MDFVDGSASRWRRPYILGYLYWGSERRADTPRNIRIRWQRWVFLAHDGSMSERPERKAESKTLYPDDTCGLSVDRCIFYFPHLRFGEFGTDPCRDVG